MITDKHNKLCVFVVLDYNFVFGLGLYNVVDKMRLKAKSNLYLIFF